jgi:hypothetical protein
VSNVPHVVNPDSEQLFVDLKLRPIINHVINQACDDDDVTNLELCFDGFDFVIQGKQFPGQAVQEGNAQLP